MDFNHVSGTRDFMIKNFISWPLLLNNTAKGNEIANAINESVNNEVVTAISLLKMVRCWSVNDEQQLTSFINNYAQGGHVENYVNRPLTRARFAGRTINHMLLIDSEYNRESAIMSGEQYG